MRVREQECGEIGRSSETGIEKLPGERFENLTRIKFAWAWVTSVFRGCCFWESPLSRHSEVMIGFPAGIPEDCQRFCPLLMKLPGASDQKGAVEKVLLTSTISGTNVSGSTPEPVILPERGQTWPPTLPPTR